MVCEHKGNGETAWLPFEYHGRYRGHIAHLVCSECCLVKNYVLRQIRALDVRLWRSEGLAVSVAGENSMQEAFQGFLGTFEFSDGHFRVITILNCFGIMPLANTGATSGVGPSISHLYISSTNVPRACSACRQYLWEDGR